MNVLRWGANMIEGTTPAGLIVAGAVLAMASPPVRRGLRSAAVVATRGLLMAAGTLQGAMASMRGNMEEIAVEAKAPVEAAADEPIRERGRMVRSVRNRGRRMAVSAAAGAVAVRDELRSIVDEARQRQENTAEDFGHPAAEPEQSARSGQTDIETDGPEASVVEAGSDSQSKRRSRAKQL